MKSIQTLWYVIPTIASENPSQNIHHTSEAVSRLLEVETTYFLSLAPIPPIAPNPSTASSSAQSVTTKLTSKTQLLFTQIQRRRPKSEDSIHAFSTQRPWFWTGFRQSSHRLSRIPSRSLRIHPGQHLYFILKEEYNALRMNFALFEPKVRSRGKSTTSYFS